MPKQVSRRRVLGLGVAAAGGLGAAFILMNNRVTKQIVVTSMPSPTILPLPTVPSPLTIVPRAAWGALPPDHEAPNEYGFTTSATEPEWYTYPDDLTGVFQTVVIHHSADLLASNETMLEIQKLHMQTNGWADIGYHYGIDRSGIIYEGRDIHARGSSVAGHNTGTIGIVVMGNFQLEEPLEVQLASAQALVNQLVTTYAPTHLAGHYEFNPESVCPGRYMLPHLDILAQKANLLRGTGGYIAPV